MSLPRIISPLHNNEGTMLFNRNLDVNIKSEYEPKIFCSFLGERCSCPSGKVYLGTLDSVFNVKSELTFITRSVEGDIQCDDETFGEVTQ